MAAQLRHLVLVGTEALREVADRDRHVGPHDLTQDQVHAGGKVRVGDRLIKHAGELCEQCDVVRADTYWPLRWAGAGRSAS